jgi:hypothetical protein
LPVGNFRGGGISGLSIIPEGCIRRGGIYQLDQLKRLPGVQLLAGFGYMICV